MPRSGPARLARHGLLPVVAAILASSGLALTLTSAGYSSDQLELHSGQVWLGSTTVDQVALVDGSTGDVVTQVRVPGLGESLSVAQAGPDAVVGDTDGRLFRVDGATWRVSSPARPVTGGPVRVLAGPQQVHVLSASGEHRRLDPRTLTAVVPAGRAGRELRLDTASVDAGERLWALAADGSLIRMDGGVPLVRPAVAGPGAAMASAASGVIVADPARRRVLALNPRGEITASGCLPSSSPVTVAGSSDGRTAVVASGADGGLTVTDLVDGSCAGPIALTGGPADFGVPVVLGGRAFVPDRDTGRVHVVDLVGRRLVVSPAVLPAGSAGLVLVARDGVVFFNDERSRRAGIVRLDGSVTEVAKYKAGKPAEGTTPIGTGNSNPEPGEDPGSSRGPSPVRSALQVKIGDVPAVAGRAAGLSVSSPQGSLTSATWSFGDGSAAGTGLALTHVWTAPGTYRLTVRAGSQTWTGPVRVVAPSAAGPQRQPPPGTGIGGPISPPISTDPAGGGPTDGPSLPPGAVLLTLAVDGQGSVEAQPAPSSGSTPCTATCELSYPAGTRVTLQATGTGAGGSPGTAFAGWSGACTGVEDCELVLTEAQSLTAIFAESLIAVDVTITGAGSVTSEPAGLSCDAGSCQGQFPAGADVVLTPTADSGARFVAWGGGCDGAGPACTFTAPTTDQSASVTFEALPQLRITIVGGGAVRGDVSCSGSCTKTFDPGASISLTADPDSNATFEGWDGDCSGTGGCTVTMNQDRAVTVRFDEIPVAAQDCIGYSRGDLAIVDEGSRWLLTDGRSRMLVLDDETDANAALALARTRTAHCFIGRPNSEMEYWTGSPGGTPDVAQPDCLNYNPDALSIQPSGSQWQLVEGSNHLVATFDTEPDAGRGLIVAQDSNRMCFIGRRSPPAETWYWLP